MDGAAASARALPLPRLAQVIRASSDPTTINGGEEEKKKAKGQEASQSEERKGVGTDRQTLRERGCLSSVNRLSLTAKLCVASPKLGTIMGNELKGFDSNIFYLIRV